MTKNRLLIYPILRIHAVALSQHNPWGLATVNQTVRKYRYQDSDPAHVHTGPDLLSQVNDVIHLLYASASCANIRLCI